MNEELKASKFAGIEVAPDNHYTLLLSAQKQIF
jgi:hypothetical protein